MSQTLAPETILKFWFEELKPSDWFMGGEALDQKIREKFLPTLQKALRSELYPWRQQAPGRLAEILVLDQFSRNIFRGSAQAFAGDPVALTLAQEVVHLGLDSNIEIGKRHFLYMPYMHSESPLIHEEAMKLFSQPGLEEAYRYEILHKKIIDRFGRFPHRNAVLGRTSTAEEIEFLKEPNSSF